VLTQAWASSALTNWKLSAPIPRCPQYSIVSRREQAIHKGGCGFCIGFGMTLRGGKSKYFPWCSVRPSLNIGMMARTASSHTSRLSRNRRPERVQLGGARCLPMPNSTRPWLRRSRVETRSATRAG